MEQQQYFMQVQMLGQEAEKIEQQIQLFDGQITEFNAVKESLEAIDSKDNDKKEILANLGKGIFIKADIKDKELYVNVGKEVVVRKDIKSTLKVVDDQVRKLLEGKEELIERIGQIQEKMQELMSRMNTGNETGCEGCSDEECKHNHAEEECDGNCDCEEPCADCKHKK
jgi:prefoldin alpha subunit